MIILKKTLAHLDAVITSSNTFYDDVFLKRLQIPDKGQ